MAAIGVDPGGDVGWVEAEEVSPLDVGNAALVHKVADVADVDAEGVGDLGDGQQPTERRPLIGSLGGGWSCSSSLGGVSRPRWPLVRLHVPPDASGDRDVTSMTHPPEPRGVTAPHMTAGSVPVCVLDAVERRIIERLDTGRGGCVGSRQRAGQPAGHDGWLRTTPPCRSGQALAKDPTTVTSSNWRASHRWSRSAR